MTKKSFENLNKETIHCKHCDRDLPKKYFSYSYVTKDGTASRCKYCDWIIRHDGVPEIEGYDSDLIMSVLRDLIYEKINYLNDLSQKYNMELKNVIYLIKKLKIGNKKLAIRTKCTNCGKEMDVVLSIYEKNQNTFCCSECYYEFKRSSSISGKNNKQYNRIKTSCSNCGKEIDVIPYDYNLKNSFGDSHNFCSQQCYWNFRKKYYIGEKSSTYNRIITDDERERMRKNILKTLKNSNRLNSKIQLITNSILDKNNIKYEREYPCKYYSIDNYLVNSNLMIEVMGDYWHSSPLKYGNEKYLLNDIQYKGIRHDKQKHTYILNHFNIEILYLWEKDIIEYPEKCEALILEYIGNNGLLHDYNSFNYSFIDNNLILNSQIIIPYINRTSDEIKKYLKTSA